MVKKWGMTPCMSWGGELNDSSLIT